MVTDTTEQGLERLICTALAGHPCDPPPGGAAESTAGYGGVGWSGGSHRDYDREYCVDLVQLAAFLRATQPETAEALALERRRADTPQVPGAASGRGVEAGHRRGAAPRHQARRARPGPVLRHAVAGQRTGQGTLRAKPFHRHPAASLQPRRDAAGARHCALHQRPAGRHVRAQEQPHQADGGRRGRAIREGPGPAREAVRARPLRRPLRRGRERGAFLHPPPGQGVIVPALRPRLERRRRQSSQSERDQDRLSVARGTDAGEPDRHPRELRPARATAGGKGGPREADAGLAPLPSARRGAPAAARRRRTRRGPALPDPALGRQRQEQLDRMAGAPADRAGEGRRFRLRFHHRGHRPAHPRPADQRHDQAICPGRGYGRPRRPFGRPPPVHRDGQEDRHLDGAEVPLHPRRDRQRAARAALRHRNRRGPFQPGRADQRGDGAGALRGGRGGRGRNLRGPHQPPDGVAQAAPQRELLRVHRHAQEQDAGNIRRARAAIRRCGQTSRIPRLHDEAGDPGGLHPGRAGALHAGEELLQARQDDRGRPGIRRGQGPEEAAALRRGTRPRDPPQGRDHGGPLPRAGALAEQDRRRGAGDGGHQRGRPRDPVLSTSSGTT